MLRCIECGAESERGVGWEARIADSDEDEPAEVVAFCPVCAEREFRTVQGSLERQGEARKPAN
jgi:hypothetical protein